VYVILIDSVAGSTNHGCFSSGEGGVRLMAAANSSNGPGIRESAIELITAERGPHDEPFGWHHWPEYRWLAYPFRRGLGETQQGGGIYQLMLLKTSIHSLI
jgi:hypothetical protein